MLASRSPNTFSNGFTRTCQEDDHQAEDDQRETKLPMSALNRLGASSSAASVAAAVRPAAASAKVLACRKT